MSQQKGARLLNLCLNLKRQLTKLISSGNLSFGEYLVLRNLRSSQNDIKRCSREGYMKAADLSELLELSRPSITRILNSLEHRGYIVRNIDKKDRRSININLTETGIEALERANRKILQIADRLVAELGEADTDKLIELIERLTEIYKRILKEHGSSNDE